MVRMRQWLFTHKITNLAIHSANEAADRMRVNLHTRRILYKWYSVSRTKKVAKVYRYTKNLRITIEALLINAFDSMRMRSSMRMAQKWVLGRVLERLRLWSYTHKRSAAVLQSIGDESLVEVLFRTRGKDGSVDVEAISVLRECRTSQGFYTLRSKVRERVVRRDMMCHQAIRMCMWRQRQCLNRLKHSAQQAELRRTAMLAIEAVSEGRAMSRAVAKFDLFVATHWAHLEQLRIVEDHHRSKDLERGMAALWQKVVV